MTTFLACSPNTAFASPGSCLYKFSISPTALSDHGSQMKAKSMAQFFKDLGISHGQRLDRSLFPDIQIRLAALPGHLHIPSTGKPDCFLHSQLQRRTLSRGNTVCHASSEAYRPASKDFFTTDKVERRRLGSAA